MAYRATARQPVSGGSRSRTAGRSRSATCSADRGRGMSAAKMTQRPPQSNEKAHRQVRGQGRRLERPQGRRDRRLRRRRRRQPPAVHRAAMRLVVDRFPHAGPRRAAASPRRPERLQEHLVRRIVASATVLTTVVRHPRIGGARHAGGSKRRPFGATHFDSGRVRRHSRSRTLHRPNDVLPEQQQRIARVAVDGVFDLRQTLADGVVEGCGVRGEGALDVAARVPDPRALGERVPNCTLVSGQRQAVPPKPSWRRVSSSTCSTARAPERDRPPRQAVWSPPGHVNRFMRRSLAALYRYQLIAELGTIRRIQSCSSRRRLSGAACRRGCSERPAPAAARGP